METETLMPMSESPKKEGVYRLEHYTRQEKFSMWQDGIWCTVADARERAMKMQQKSGDCYNASKVTGWYAPDANAGMKARDEVGLQMQKRAVITATPAPRRPRHWTEVGYPRDSHQISPQWKQVV